MLRTNILTETYLNQNYIYTLLYKNGVSLIIRYIGKGGL